MLLVFYLFLFLLAKPIQASEILFEDSFNTSDLSSWKVVRSSQHHHPQEPCFDGAYPAEWKIKDGRLGITINGNPCTTEIIPQNLDLTAINNYEFEFEWYFPTSTHMDRNVLIKWQDENNWYGLHIVDSKLLLQKVVEGQLKSLYNNWGYYGFQADQSYDFKISVINDLITVWVNNHQILQTLDRPPFLTGHKTMGLQAGSGAIFRSESYFDNLIVRSLDQVGEKRLNVSLYKQHDPEWKNQEYNHANEWSKTDTIARWGCALTSATMILDYHGINQIPSGRQLDPAKLNLWLKNQADGFIGEGLVNWLAITRLTQIMSTVLNTPILEYQWLEGKVENVIDEINQNKPVILQLPGHFLIADGYTAQQTDLFIKDPAYNRHLFSQHQTDLLSVRSFKPSQTDLSYLLIVHDPEIKVTLFDESDQIPAELKIYSEHLYDPIDESGDQTKIKIIQSLAKPPKSKYLLKIENNETENKKVEIYAYDIKGEVTILTQEISKTKLFNLNFNSTGESQLTEITNKFTLLRDLLKSLYESGEITTKYAYLKLDQLAAFAEKDEKNQNRYQNLIIKTAQELKKFVPYLTIIRSLTPSN